MNPSKQKGMNDSYCLSFKYKKNNKRKKLHDPRKLQNTSSPQNFLWPLQSGQMVVGDNSTVASNVAETNPTLHYTWLPHAAYAKRHTHVSIHEFLFVPPPKM